MNFSCVFLLALALFGAVSQGYITSGSIGYGGCGGVGCGGVGGIGYNGVYETANGGAYGAGYGVGYGAGYETAGYGCRTACAPTAVCDSCQCLKTIVRPSIERVPYACSRRVQSATCRSSCGLYSGAGYTGVAGPIVGAGAGYMNGGYMY